MVSDNSHSASAATIVVAVYMPLISTALMYTCYGYSIPRNCITFIPGNMGMENVRDFQVPCMTSGLEMGQTYCYSSAQETTMHKFYIDSHWYKFDDATQ